MTPEIKKEIWRLYFDEFYSYEELIEYYKGKFTYSQIKKVIEEKYGDER